MGIKTKLRKAVKVQPSKAVSKAVPAPDPIKPLTPVQVCKEMDALEHLYEKTSLLTSEAFDSAKDKLNASLAAWFAQ